MSERSIFANLIWAPDGSVSTTHGPFSLHSALQPVLRETSDGALHLEALEGLVRVGRNGEPCAPADFFASVASEDRARIDSLCRNLHILNAGALHRRSTILIVKVDAGLPLAGDTVRHEIDRMRVVAREAGLAPERIACEIRKGRREETLGSADLARQLQEHGFLVAIDGYCGDDEDLERLRLLRPDFVKFDSAWLASLASSSAGLALLRVLVDRFHREGTEPIVAGIEEPWQIDLCRDLGTPLMEGFLLARPERAPTSFNLHFPEDEPSPLLQGVADEAGERIGRRYAVTFGKRGA